MKTSHLLQWAVLLIILVATYRLVRSNWSRRIYLALTLPGPAAWPLIGNAHLAARSGELENIANNAYKYGRMLRFWICFLPVFILTEPDDLKKVLLSDKNNDKTYFYALMHNFLGEGLITTNGDSWKLHRKLLQVTFHKRILREYIEVYAHRSNCLVSQLSNEQNQNINITSFINDLILDVLNEAVLGISANNTLGKSPFRQGKLMTLQRLTKPWLLLDVLYNFTMNSTNEMKQNYNLKSYTRNLIQLKRKETDAQHCKSLLSRMLEISENNPNFNEEDVVNEITTFMLAGQDSVASAVAFCLYFVAKDQSIQDLAHDEQRTIFSDSNRIPSIEDLNKMEYLDRCIKETLRLCPSVPLISRKLGEDVLIGNRVLPVGTDVLISPFITHRLPHVYPDPFKFDPGRFTSEESCKRDSCAYLPFSVGPRNCIGYRFALLEMRTILSTVLRKFRLSVTEGYELKLTFRVTLRAKGGIWLKFEPRAQM